MPFMQYLFSCNVLSLCFKIDKTSRPKCEESQYLSTGNCSLFRAEELVFVDESSVVELYLIFYIV